MQEIWAKLIYPSIPDEKNRFEISSFGRLRNELTGHVYKLDLLSSGYYSVRVTLGSRKDKMHIIIHKAVAHTFLSNPDNLPEVNHKNGDKTKNYVDNLKWCSSHENQQHKYDVGLFDKSFISGENNHNSKLKVEDVKYIREHYIKGSREFGAHAMARKFSVSTPTILSLLNNKTWSFI